MAPDPVTKPSRPPTTVVASGRSVTAHVKTVWAYRELLVNLVRKELKVRYKNSALGFLWSLLNPALYLAVFTIVFQVVLGSGIPYFAIYLLSGLLAWNLFSASLAGATGSITGGASLVNKVYFPREILPLASVGANCVHFLLQALVLFGAVALSPISFDAAWLWLIVPTMLVLVVLAAALAILLSAINVYARDTQHFLELFLLAWFWMTPIVYQWGLPAKKLAEHDLPTWLLLLNPVVPVTLALQRSLYGITHFVDVAGNYQQVLPEEGQLWYLRNLGFAGIFSVLLLIFALRVFDRLEGNFAEEL
jgi:ABC-2 type transport system permease protein